MTGQRAHSPWGGSSIGRIRACSGSYALSLTCPPRGTTAAAEEGTRYHALAEHCLREAQDPMDFVGMTLDAKVDAKPFDQDGCEAVKVYYDAVMERADTPGAKVWIEHRFELNVASVLPGEVFGSCDALVYEPALRRLTVYDFKNGFLDVPVEDNAQAKFYAAGAALSLDLPIKTVDLCIVQPRAQNVDDVGPVKYWGWGAADLLDYVQEVDAAIVAALAPGAPLAAGKHCRWCPAIAVCPAKQQPIAEALGVADLSAITAAALPQPGPALTSERLGELLRAIDLLKGWATNVESYAEGLLRSGLAVPGRKLVEKQARRRWAASDDAVAGYLAGAYGVPDNLVRPPKLATITEVEKLLAQYISDKRALSAAKTDITVKFMVKESSGLTMAPDNDPRPAHNAGAAFGGVSA